LEAATLKLGAKFFGRWRSGAPLVLAPDKDDPALGADKERRNDFCFEPTDSRGYACPFGAHMRRANPRDSISLDPVDESLKTANRHRFMRRGIPYGGRLFENEVLNLKPDGKPRGLHFIALATNIKRQFEFVQQQWVNNGQFNGMFNDKDPVIGNNDGTCQLTLQRPVGRQTIPGLPRFVTTRGGGYFFVPSITALRYLSSL
jgi:Dyp-type peroxidase family